MNSVRTDDTDAHIHTGISAFVFIASRCTWRMLWPLNVCIIEISVKYACYRVQCTLYLPVVAINSDFRCFEYEDGDLWTYQVWPITSTPSRGIVHARVAWSVGKLHRLRCNNFPRHENYYYAFVEDLVNFGRRTRMKREKRCIWMNERASSTFLVKRTNWQIYEQQPTNRMSSIVRSEAVSKLKNLEMFILNLLLVSLSFVGFSWRHKCEYELETGLGCKSMRQSIQAI